MFGEVAQLCNPLWKREITIAARDETMKVKYDIDNKWEIIVEIFKFINSSSFDIIISENVKTEANQWLVQEFLFMIMSRIPECYKKMDLFLILGKGYEEIKLKSEEPVPRIKDMINSESVWRLCCRKSAKSVFTANSIIPHILSPDKSNCEENNNNRPLELHTLQTRNNLKGILNRVAWQCKPLLKRRVSIAARGEILKVALVGKKEATNCVKKILTFINLSPFDIIFSDIYNSEINHWSVAKFLNKFQVEMSKCYYGWEAFLKLEKRTEVKLEWFSRTCFTKIEDVINSELNWKLCIRPQTDKTTLDLQAPYVQHHPNVIKENLSSNLNLCIGQQPSWSPPNIPAQCEVNVLMQSPIFKESMNQILQMYRIQSNIVILTDERDNFDITLAGFDPRVHILKIPGMKFETVFNYVKTHPYYGKGTIFIFSCGIHDLLHSFCLQECLNVSCTTPQTLLSILSAASDSHSLIRKVIQLNRTLLLSTQNDIALFSGIIPVNVDQYNSLAVKNRPCLLRHQAAPVQLVGSIQLYFAYQETIAWYNSFTKYHAQILGFRPWDLEASFFIAGKQNNIMHPNGYNICPDEETNRAKHAKVLLYKILQTFTTGTQSAIQPSLLNQPTTSYLESTLLFENKSSSDAHFELTTIFENKASADCCREANSIFENKTSPDSCRESNSIFENKTFPDSHYELNTKCESKANPNPRFESIPIFDNRASTNSHFETTTIFENKASHDSHFKSTTMFEIKASTNFHIESTKIFENEARPELHFDSSLILENRASPDFHIESTTSFEKNASFDSHFESTPVFENKESTNSHSEATSVFKNKASPDSHVESAATFESKVGSKKNTEMHGTFHKVFFVGRSDLIDTLKDCNNNSSLICYTFDTYSKYEISNLLKQLYVISGNSVCCLVFDISVISKPLISTECFKRGCKEPLYPSALKIKNLNSSQAIFKELKDIISEQLQLVKKFIEKLSVHLPVIILPLAPMRIYCHDESSMQNHQISHSMSGLRTCVASGPRHLWKQAIAILVKSWYNLMELTNRKYDPLQCLSHCKSANQTVFPFVEGVGDILSTWSEPDNWKSLINSYTSSLIPTATQIDPYMTTHENLNASYTRKQPKSRSSSPNKRFCSQSLKQHKSLRIEFVGHEETSSVINDMKKFTSKLITDFDSRGTSDHTSSCRIEKSDLDSLRRSRSRPSPRLRSFSRAKESVSFLTETCNDKNLHSSEPELRVRFGPASFSEYSSKLEEIKLSFKEEFLIFKSVPELHPNFEKYYEIFAATYHRKHINWDEDHKDREWKIFWKSNFDTIKAKDWQIKHENFKKEFEEKSKMISSDKDEKKILHIHSTVWNEVMKDEPFVFDKAVYLVASLCDNAPYLGPAVASVIETNRNLGTVTKEAYKVFTESENVSLLNLLSQKFESLIQTTTDAITCYMYRKAVEWIPKLLEESETCCKINANEPEDESTLVNINAVAKLSSGKRPAEIKETIKWALTYEGISDPSAKLIDDLFLKVNSLH